jgi:hypothetical protein
MNSERSPESGKEVVKDGRLSTYKKHTHKFFMTAHVFRYKWPQYIEAVRAMMSAIRQSNSKAEAMLET